MVVAVLEMSSLETMAQEACSLILSDGLPPTAAAEMVVTYQPHAYTEPEENAFAVVKELCREAGIET